ncbi:hypothetical protein CLU92_4786 [Janthinobacterium sp. 61]|uniref:hypothetical protein n=1 Tax=Janthinobacterium sp. 61 TaxID=2035209 RepID=UPI000C711933|nr:hypothetical protein [Janthinobacterium sp. 61]PKV47339.1 hypothetical protein CLU92_4786 [Janthinobacterium sp. 61]
MTTHPTKLSHVHTAASLAQRRDALLAECTLQRLALGVQTRQLLEPLTGGNLRHTLATRFKIPLMLGGAALGLLLVRPRRFVPVLLAGASLLKHANAALPLIRTLLHRVGKQAPPPP